MDNTISNKKRVSSIFAASSGNLVEWFDFYIYAYGSMYFASQFSASDDPTLALITAFGIFALGFLMRPIGSYVFGALADKIGRKHSMVSSVLLMAFGSFMIAILPTYSHVGDFAAILLLVARLIQGLSVGGEYGIAATYLSELAKDNKKGFYGSFQYVTLIGGQLLASVSIYVLFLLIGSEAMHEYGWRILFATGGILAILSLLLRKNMVESGKEAMEHKKRGEFKELLKYKSSFIKLVLFTAGGSLAFYTFTIYSKVYLGNAKNIPAEDINYIMPIALFVFMVIQPIWGAITDKIGRRISLFIFGGLSLISVYPIFKILGSTSSTAVALFCLIYLLVILTPYTSIAGIVKAELFPPHIRALGTGLSYAIGNSIFGGSASYVALEFKRYGYENYFFVYVMIILLVLIAMVAMFPKKTYMK